MPRLTLYPLLRHPAGCKFLVSSGFYILTGSNRGADMRQACNKLNGNITNTECHVQQLQNAAFVAAVVSTKLGQQKSASTQNQPIRNTSLHI